MVRPRQNFGCCQRRRTTAAPKGGLGNNSSINREEDVSSLNRSSPVSSSQIIRNQVGLLSLFSVLALSCSLHLYLHHFFFFFPLSLLSPLRPSPFQPPSAVEISSIIMPAVPSSIPEAKKRGWLLLLLRLRLRGPRGIGFNFLFFFVLSPFPIPPFLISLKAAINLHFFSLVHLAPSE